MLVPSGFVPDFARGLVAAIAQDIASREVLMLAWMNEAAWHATLATGEAHYFSRSRGRIWHKGESSGHIQKVRAIRMDCDADAILLEVEQTAGACHEGYRSCFFRRFVCCKPEVIEICSPRIFDPDNVYGK